jgi:hypothetical protein
LTKIKDLTPENMTPENIKLFIISRLPPRANKELIAKEIVVKENR